MQRIFIDNHDRILCYSNPAGYITGKEAVVDTIDNEDIGFVITENGLPDMVLIPFRWFAENFPDEVPDDLRSADYKSG